MKTTMSLAAFAALLLTIHSSAQATTLLDDFEDGIDDGWGLVTWFDPGYAVTANWQIVSYDQQRGLVYRGTDFGNGLAYRTDFSAADMDISADIQMADMSQPGAHSAIIARFDPQARTGYEFGMRTDGADGANEYTIEYVLIKLDGTVNGAPELGRHLNVFTIPRSGATPWVSLRMVLIDNQITCYADGEEIFSVADASWSWGTAGAFSATDCDFGSACQSTYVDNFRAQSLDAVPAQPTTWGVLKSRY